MFIAEWHARAARESFYPIQCTALDFFLNDDVTSFFNYNKTNDSCQVIHVFLYLGTKKGARSFGRLTLRRTPQARVLSERTYRECFCDSRFIGDDQWIKKPLKVTVKLVKTQNSDRLLVRWNARENNFTLNAYEQSVLFKPNEIRMLQP